MSLIAVEKVTHAYAAVEILRHVSLRVGESDRIGLVGPNGAGKSTLLRIIAGLMEPLSGKIHHSAGLKIGYLPQDPPALSGSTIYDAMLDAFSELRRMEADLEDLAGRMGDDTDAMEQYGRMQHEFEDRGGYEYTSRIEQVLTGLGFDKDIWSRPLANLSGGQRTRAYLAKLLLGAPDVLMLDEPTNHLDLETVEWLEGWLNSFRGALVVVSHDRYLLDNATTQTWEVAFGVVEKYRGAYSKYLTLRAERYLERQRQWEAQQAYITKTQEFIRIHIAGQRTKEAQGRRSRLERFIRDEAISEPQDHQAISLELTAPVRSGDIVLRSEELAIGYQGGPPLMADIELNVERGQRIAILGGNGTGKTTLVRTILGQLPSLAGKIRTGANVEMGYLSQTHASLDPEGTALDAVVSIGGCTYDRARSLLGALLLSGDDGLKKIRELSGGQRSRVVLAQLVAQSANVLMLDEPTNHLDIPSSEIMQNVLQRFEGTSIFVTHDRYLVQAAATHVWALEDGKLYSIVGGWREYLAWRERHRAGGVVAKPADQDKAARQAKRRQDRKQANLVQRLKRRHEQLEGEIDTVEARLEAINKELSV
ncbi:MAG: ABC-F family ATP-binding cassette domain-containing protein, partial [bacterium]|nr:ABC-F family ATP-binding cassette domain-containing protein [bacterium]